MGAAFESADKLWATLRYFSLYRLVVAAVFLVAFLLTNGSGNIGSENGILFLWVAAGYLAVACLFLFLLRRFHQAFNLQLSIQVACDVLALVLLMYASGGAKSGISIMLVVVVAGAGLVGEGRLTLFYAALATIGVLSEQYYRMVHFNDEPDILFRIALLGTGFFATAIIARRLAARALANEALARHRGIELERQIRINQHVIRDMDDGILVVDGKGRIQLHNPKADALLGRIIGSNNSLAEYSPPLAKHLGSREGRDETNEILSAGVGKALLARVLPPAADGYTLIYLQDLGRAQAQAQQIKLAALGRLTANLAHEIRNPLGAISHATELLGEEQRLEVRTRLLRITGDNINRLNRLVSEVLELGRRDRAEPENIAIAGFLERFLEEYALHDPSARHRITIFAPSDLQMIFDRAHLHRILENLLTNALRYASSEAGAIRIESRATARGQIELHFTDDGPGIPESDRTKIFEPFFTTRGTGTGLGLYIARELCEANNARLELLEPGAGAHFCIIAKEGKCPANPNVEPTAR